MIFFNDRQVVTSSSEAVKETIPMRIGYCSNLINTQANGTGSQLTNKGKDYGFDYIELLLAEITVLNESAVKVMRSFTRF